MVDTHCHIIPQFDFNNPDEVIQNAKNAGVNKMICIGCDFEDIEQTLPLSEKYKGVVFASIGLHPETVKEDTDIDEVWNRFEKIAVENKDKIFGIGECGLDYHYSDNKIIHEKQKDLFERHIKLSIDLDKPLIIHTRDAWNDTFDILEKWNLKDKKTSHHIIEDENEFPNMKIDLTCGILHSFTGGIEEAKKCVELGFKLGINGIITFKTKTADPIREVVKEVGKENIVLETDSPFLSPEPYRGKVNEPARIKEIAEYIQKMFE